jgi:pseudouridine synthase
VRLQRALARAGVASRRRAEDLILGGRVRVNGRVVAELGARVDPDRDVLVVDDRVIASPLDRTYLALHKPRGYLTTAHDPQGRPTVMSLVPHIPGLVPVGRLDAESEGLLLLTTDGEWAQRVSHPRYGASKEYLVQVHGMPSPDALARLQRPLELAPGEVSSGAEISVIGVSGGDASLRIVLHEGRNRQIRRMLAMTGHSVRRLLRVRVGGVTLGRLRPGHWRRLREHEITEAQVTAGTASLVVPRAPRTRLRSGAPRGLRPAAWRRAQPA